MQHLFEQVQQLAAAQETWNAESAARQQVVQETSSMLQGLGAQLKALQETTQQLMQQQMQLQQQFALLQQQRAPRDRTYKVAKPSKFHGDKWNATELNTWAQAVEIYFYCEDIPANRQAVVASSFLGGPAAQWWKAWIGDKPLGGAGTWDEMKEELTKYFSPERSEEEARDRLVKLRQQGPLVNYVNSFREIIVLIPTMDETEMYHRFKEGITDKALRKELEYRKVKTWQEAVSVGLRFESIFNHDKQIRTLPATSRAEDTGAIPVSVPTVNESMDLSAATATTTATNRLCWNCDSPNHIARDCPEKRKEEFRGRRRRGNWNRKKRDQQNLN